MKRVAVWFATTATLVVLLFAYHTSTDRSTSGGDADGSATPVARGRQFPGAGRSPSPTPSDRPRPTAAGSRRPKAPATAAASTTYTGRIIQTSRGPVEVRIVVRSDRIVAVAVPVHPGGDPLSVQINSYALPRLVQETRSAQNSHIDMISGATITSDGYRQSLQSALDKAGIR